MTHASSWKSWFLGCVLLVLAACGGIPDRDRAEAEAIPAKIAAARDAIAQKERAFNADLVKDPELAAYLKREQASRAFVNARAYAGRASASYDEAVRPVLDRDDEKELPNLRTGMAKVQEALASARAFAARPGSRLKRLADAKYRSGAWPAEARRLSAAAESDYRAMSALVARYQAAHPTRRSAIADRFAPGEGLRSKVRDGMRDVASQEANKAAGSPVDYARFADGHAAVVDGQRALGVLRQTLEKDLPSLDQAYSKILVDMRTEYEVQAARTSWNESYDFPSETEHAYPPIKVSEDAFETAEQYDELDAEFATYRSWWGSWDLSFSPIGDATSEDIRQLWNELRVNPQEAFPDGDDYSSFWIANATARYFHRYAYVRNGVRTTGGWEEVTPELFEDHWDDLGLALVEKPYGSFENEVVKTPAPPGMALVGNTTAGEWRTAPSGGTYWFWFPPYANTYGGYYGPGWGGYSRAEWEDYDRHRRRGSGYYGSGIRTYGSAGSATKTGPLSASEFAKRGGFREAAAEIRTAGPSGRSGGPQSGK